jgi:hypothetical protein
MPKPRITKTLSLERTVVFAIEKIARQERRSFTRQCEIMLEHALGQKTAPQPVKEAV